MMTQTLFGPGMKNPFRTPTNRRTFDLWVKAYLERKKNLFHAGRRHQGSSFAAAFWAGYDGLSVGSRVPSRDMLAWPIYRAGQACRVHSPLPDSNTLNP